MPRERTRVLVIAWCALLWCWTFDRAFDWTSERALWAGAVAHAPDKPRPWVNLGHAYARDGEAGMAEDAMRHAIALARAPQRIPEERQLGRAIAETNLALLWIARGDRHAADLLLTQVIERTGPSFLPPLRIRRWLQSPPADSSSPASF